MPSPFILKGCSYRECLLAKEIFFSFIWECLYFTFMWKDNFTEYRITDWQPMFFFLFPLFMRNQLIIIFLPLFMMIRFVILKIFSLFWSFNSLMCDSFHHFPLWNLLRFWLHRFFLVTLRKFQLLFLKKRFFLSHISCPLFLGLPLNECWCTLWFIMSQRLCYFFIFYFFVGSGY